MKIYSSLLLLIFAIFFIGCNDQTEQAKHEVTHENETVDESAGLTDEQQITATLTEMFGRIIEGDKTVLWEMEFQYLTDSINLDEYMRTPRVLNYIYDTLSGITVDSITLMGDSAVAYVVVHYESLGGKTDRNYPLTVYQYKERWVRPYLSVYVREVEYQELLKSYYESIEDE